MNRLAGQGVVITGATRGIGRAIAGRLAEAGMRVGVLGRDGEALEQLARALAPAVQATAVCDLADLDSIPAAVHRLGADLGDIHALVNNAGVFLERPLAEIGTAEWERALRINLGAPFVLCRELIPRLIASGGGGGGRIVNIASTAGSQGYLNQSAYCASKHGLLGLSRALAIEMKPHGIHVSCVSPGGVHTDFIKGTLLGERLRGQTMIQPEDVAETVRHVLELPGHVDVPEVVMRRF